MKNKNKSLNNWISIIVLIVFLIIGRYYVSDEKNNTITNVSNVENSGNSITENIRKSNNNQNTKNLINNVNDINSSYFGNSNENQSILGADSVDWNNDKLNIMFFYVGQADSSFIKLNDKSILIDAGNNGDGENISKFLKEKGINKIDYLIGTHCDEDHIGGLDEIIDNIDVENIMMPSHGSETVNYKNVVKSAKKKNLQVNNPNVGDDFKIDNLDMKILSVENNNNYSDNNSSIVTEFTYFNNKFLFMGDAEKEIENKYSWEKVDVLKVGHHGSNTSSTSNFLKQVKPNYSVIEVGKNNSYRLPNKYTIKRLESIGTTILRTDTNESSFFMKSDGNSIDVSEINLNLNYEE